MYCNCVKCDPFARDNSPCTAIENSDVEEVDVEEVEDYMYDYYNDEDNYEYEEEFSMSDFEVDEADEAIFVRRCENGYFGEEAQLQQFKLSEKRYCEVPDDETEDDLPF